MTSNKETIWIGLQGKKQMLMPVSREVAELEMAKAMCSSDFSGGCAVCMCKDEEECSCVVEDSKYIKLAEVALDALIGKE